MQLRYDMTLYTRGRRIKFNHIYNALFSALSFRNVHLCAWANLRALSSFDLPFFGFDGNLMWSAKNHDSWNNYNMANRNILYVSAFIFQLKFPRALISQ